MLTVRRTQLNLLDAARLPELEEAVHTHLRQFFPVDFALLGSAQMKVIVRHAFQAAERYGFDTLGETCRYANLMMALGSGFDRDPLLRWAGAILAMPTPAASRLAMLQDSAVSFIERVMGPDGLLAVKAVLRARAVTWDEINGQEPTLTRLLREIYPSKFAAIEHEDIRAYVDLSRAAAVRAGLSSRAGHRLYACIGFLLGSNFMVDPLQPWAAAVLAENEGLEPRERALSLFERGKEEIERVLSLMQKEN